MKSILSSSSFIAPLRVPSFLSNVCPDPKQSLLEILIVLFRSLEKHNRDCFKQTKNIGALLVLNYLIPHQGIFFLLTGRCPAEELETPRSESKTHWVLLRRLEVQGRCWPSFCVYTFGFPSRAQRRSVLCSIFPGPESFNPRGSNRKCFFQVARGWLHHVNESAKQPTFWLEQFKWALSSP